MIVNAVENGGGVDPAEDQPTQRVRKSSSSAIAAGQWALTALEPLEATAHAFQVFRQARSATEGPTVDSWARGFYGLREHAQLFRDLHHWDPAAADRLAHALTSMPEVGAHFLDFQLMTPLGRGAFARVYLARQADLANRQVVVKIAADLWGEANTLAQLQHPHIVPIFSVHQREPFQVVCMPYLGWTTFQDVLRHVQGLEHFPRSGSAIVQAIKPAPNKAAPVNYSTSPTEGPALARLAGLSYVEAIVELAAKVADGLAFAHENGIVHHDLKPANILLTDDGQPMLLDFNAAEDTKHRPGVAVAWVAGTWPYMAPERIGAMRGAPACVDARSDLFAFGVILYELLTRRYPFHYPDTSMGAIFDKVLADRRGAPPGLRDRNPAVSPALEAIVRRCLESDPDRRYPSARALCDDLQRQRDHLPLLHQPEPSRRERVQKWTRRHPRLLWIGLAASAVGLLLAGFGTLAWHRGQELERLRAQQVERTEQQKARDRAAAAWDDFQHDLKTAQFILFTRTNEPEQRDDGIELAMRMIDGYGVLGVSDWQSAPLVQALPIDHQGPLGDAMGELLLLTARALRLQYLDEPAEMRTPERLDRAIRLLDRAAACSPALAESPESWRQRAALLKLLGKLAEAAECAAKAEAMPLRAAADFYWLAGDHIASGRLSKALPLLQEAIAREPQNFWAWFVLGNAQDRLSNYAESKACYGTCIALKPDYVWSYFNRGLARLNKQEYRGACVDFDVTLKMRPDLTDAYLNRALARQGLQQYREAEQDLTEALEHGGPTRLLFLRARVREKLGDFDGAKSDQDAGLETAPLDEKSWVTRGYYWLAHDPKAALADFDQALRLNPRSADALQNKAHVLAEKLGRNKEALAVLDRALDLYPESVKARGGRGVLHARLGQRDAALSDAEETLRRDSSPARLYQVACIYALTSKIEPDDRWQAFKLLSASLRQGYGFNLLDSDDDLNPLRSSPEFRRLVDAARALRTPPVKSKKL